MKIKDYSQKIENVKEDYPPFFIAFCKYSEYPNEMMTFITDCLKIEEKREWEKDPIKFDKYIFGGVIPMLEIQRDMDLLKTGKYCA